MSKTQPFALGPDFTIPAVDPLALCGAGLLEWRPARRLPRRDPRSQRLWILDLGVADAEVEALGDLRLGHGRKQRVDILPGRIRAVLHLLRDRRLHHAAFRR